jgi:hypothetical protein
VGEGDPMMLMADSEGRLPLHLAAAAGALGPATALASAMVMAMVSSGSELCGFRGTRGVGGG